MTYIHVSSTRRWAINAFALTFAAPFVRFLAYAQDAGAERFDIAIEGGRLVGGAKSLRVTEGDHVTLRLISDSAIEVHLHGYDIEQAVAPGEVAIMSFEAFATGRFPVSVHGVDHGESTLIYIEVYPR